MSKKPIIQTERLTLDTLGLSDVDEIARHCNNPNISKYLANVPFPYTKADAIWWVKHSEEQNQTGALVNFAIRKKQSNLLIGTIGLIPNMLHKKANVGYWLGEEYWNKGFMTEALTALIRFSFKQLNLNKVYASHFIENPASGKVLLKSGMIQEAILKQEFFREGKFHDIARYAIFNPNNII